MWYLIINCIPTLGILISILAQSSGNLNRMTFINIVFIAIYCKMVGHLINIYCPTVGHLIENLLKKSNTPPMPDPPPLGLNIDRCITCIFRVICWGWVRECRGGGGGLARVCVLFLMIKNNYYRQKEIL